MLCLWCTSRYADVCHRVCSTINPLHFFYFFWYQLFGVKSKIVGEIKFIRSLSVRISAVLYLKAAVFWNVLWQVCISATCSLQISCWPWIINTSKCTLHNTHDFQRSFLRHKMQKQSRYKMITRQGSKWLIELVQIGPFLYELIFFAKSSSSHSSQKSLALTDIALKLTLVALYAMQCTLLGSQIWRRPLGSAHLCGNLCTCPPITCVPVLRPGYPSWWGRLPDHWFLTFSCFKKAPNNSLF